MSLLHAVVDLRIAAGDPQGAHAIAEEMFDLAYQPGIVPAGQLAQAAAAFNDLGEHETAAKLLKEALTKVPRNQQVIALGRTLGPITGSSLGLADSLVSEIAVELYRSGDAQGFEDLQDRLSSWYRSRSWFDLCEASELGNWSHPSKQACLAHVGSNFLVQLAIDAAIQNQTKEADQYLNQAVSVYRSGDTIEVVRNLLDVVRMAAANDNRSVVEIALVTAARVADHVINPGDREAELLEVAALRKELRP
jgi:tetratricopeptide (TPR) repeat protein